MPATREQLLAASKKGVKSPNIGKRGKNKVTIAKENARGYVEDAIRARLPELIGAHFDVAMGHKVRISDKLIYDKSPDGNQLRYLTDQIIGKAAEKLEVTGKDGGAIEVNIKLIAAIHKIYGGKEVD